MTDHDPLPSDNDNVQEPLRVNLLPEAWKALEWAATLTGERKTDCVNRAIIFYAQCHEAQAANGQVYLAPGGGLAPEPITVL